VHDDPTEVRGGARELREGIARARTAVIEFPTYKAALACYNSQTYQDAKALRDPISTGNLVIVNGFNG